MLKNSAPAAKPLKKRVVIDQKIVRDTDGRVHGPIRIGLQFSDDERRASLRAMMSGLLAVADRFKMSDFVFDTMTKSAESHRKGE